MPCSLEHFLRQESPTLIPFPHFYHEDTEIRPNVNSRFNGKSVAFEIEATMPMLAQLYVSELKIGAERVTYPLWFHSFCYKIPQTLRNYRKIYRRERIAKNEIFLDALDACKGGGC